MQTTAKQSEPIEQLPLRTDDTLKERFGKAPLFVAKIEKAKKIMERVREQETQQQQ